MGTHYKQGLRENFSGIGDDLFRFIRGFNEVFFLVDEDRFIVAASGLGRDLLNLSSDESGRYSIDNFFPKVYLDAIFSRSRKEEGKNMSLTFPVKGKNGKEVVLETRFNWTAFGGRDLLTLSCRDINYYVETLNHLSNREELYRTIFHESPLGFVHVSSDGILTDCNAAFLSIFGLDRYEVISVCLAEENDLRIYSRFKRAAMDAVMGVHSRHESQFEFADGSYQGWVRVSFSPVKSDEQVFFGAIGIVEDITEARRSVEKVRFISSHDALTGLFNRHACEEAIESFDNPDCLPLAIIYADLNCLKLANDAFGHQEGDVLLQAASAILRNNLTPNDQAFRWGGDEFVILLKNTGITAAADRTKAMTEMCDSWSEYGFVRPSIALGHAVKTFKDQNFVEIMKNAEDAMYAQKLRDGRKTRTRILDSLEMRMHGLMDSAVAARSRRMIKWGKWAVGNLEIKDSVEALKLLFRYHDIGMLAYVDELRYAGSDPAANKIAAPMQHMAVGYRIARSIAEIAYIAEPILYHHEWWDGMGYPSQLSGDEIPYLSRLVSIFDAIEGMLSFSKGREVSLEDVLVSMEVCAGMQYDPFLTMEIINKLRNDPPEFINDMEG
jgi:diguanylate cyclase (GGDEF)-like protein/PAS domain S-box-containing protein